MANSPATDPTIRNIGTTPVLFFPVPTPWPMSTGCNKNIYRQNNRGSILAWDPIYPQIAASALTERRQSCFPTQQQSWHFQDLNATPSTALGPAFVCPESYSAVAATVLESNSASRTEFTYCCPPYVPSSPHVAADSYPIHELTPPQKIRPQRPPRPKHTIRHPMVPPSPPPTPNPSTNTPAQHLPPPRRLHPLLRLRHLHPHRPRPRHHHHQRPRVHPILHRRHRHRRDRLRRPHQRLQHRRRRRRPGGPTRQPQQQHTHWRGRSREQ